MSATAFLPFSSFDIGPSPERGKEGSVVEDQKIELMALGRAALGHFLGPGGTGEAICPPTFVMVPEASLC